MRRPVQVGLAILALLLVLEGGFAFYSHRVENRSEEVRAGNLERSLEGVVKRFAAREEQTRRAARAVVDGLEGSGA